MKRLVFSPAMPSFLVHFGSSKNVKPRSIRCTMASKERLLADGKTKEQVAIMTGSKRIMQKRTALQIEERQASLLGNGMNDALRCEIV